MASKEYLVMFSASYKVDAENEEEACKKAEDIFFETLDDGIYPFDEEII